MKKNKFKKPIPIFTVNIQTNKSTLSNTEEPQVSFIYTKNLKSKGHDDKKTCVQRE